MRVCVRYESVHCLIVYFLPTILWIQCQGMATTSPSNLVLNRQTATILQTSPWSFLRPNTTILSSLPDYCYFMKPFSCEDFQYLWVHYFYLTANFKWASSVISRLVCIDLKARFKPVLVFVLFFPSLAKSTLNLIRMHASQSGVLYCFHWICFDGVFFLFFVFLIIIKKLDKLNRAFVKPNEQSSIQLEPKWRNISGYIEPLVSVLGIFLSIRKWIV